MTILRFLASSKTQFNSTSTSRTYQISATQTKFYPLSKYSSYLSSNRNFYALPSLALSRNTFFSNNYFTNKKYFSSNAQHTVLGFTTSPDLEHNNAIDQQVQSMSINKAIQSLLSQTSQALDIQIVHLDAIIKRIEQRDPHEKSDCFQHLLQEIDKGIHQEQHRKPIDYQHLAQLYILKGHANMTLHHYFDASIDYHLAEKAHPSPEQSAYIKNQLRILDIIHDHGRHVPGINVHENPSTTFSL